MFHHPVFRWLLQPSPERETYRNAKGAFLAQVGYSIGLGNFWRFSAKFYQHGGASFVIAYVVCMLCVGLPLHLLELSLGQFVGLGPTHIFSYMCPILGGIGWGMMVIRVLISVYYNVILGWSVFYTGVSIYSGVSYSPNLPWSPSPEIADNSYNSAEQYYQSAKDYFRHTVLGLPSNSSMCAALDQPWVDQQGPYELQWGLVLCLGLSWLLVCVCLLQGISHTTKVLYVTVIYPYLVLICLFGINFDDINGEAKDQWLHNLTTVDTSFLERSETWVAASTQVIYSLGVGFGGASMVASHNKLSQNVIRDSFLLCLLDLGTSLISANVLSSLAVMDSPQKLGDSFDISQMVFIVFSATLARINTSLWSLLFFSMIFALGFDSMLLMVEAITTTLLDHFKRLGQCHLLLIGGTSIMFFLLGLPLVTHCGIYAFELMHEYTAKHSLLFLALMEVVVASHVYGHKKVLSFMKDYFKLRVPAPLRWYLSATWLVITPGCLLLILGFTLGLEDWNMDTWQCISGQAIAFAPLLPLPVIALYTYCTRGDKSTEDLVTPTPDFGPHNFRKADSPQCRADPPMDFSGFRYPIENYI